LTEESSYSGADDTYIPELVYIVRMWPVGPILDVQQQ